MDRDWATAYTTLSNYRDGSDFIVPTDPDPLYVRARILVADDRRGSHAETADDQWVKLLPHVRANYIHTYLLHIHSILGPGMTRRGRGRKAT